MLQRVKFSRSVYFWVAVRYSISSLCQLQNNREKDVDEKLLAKILATSLEYMILIHPDQVRFVVVFCLDAAKTFDKEEFSCLFYTLQKSDFGPSRTQ